MPPPPHSHSNLQYDMNESNGDRGEISMLKLRISELEKREKDLLGDLEGERRERASDQRTMLAYQSDVTRLQEENRKLKEYITDKEKKTGKGYTHICI